jgi:hypothetical protein
MHRSSKGPGFAAVGAGLVLGVTGTVLPNGPLSAQVRDAPAIAEEASTWEFVGLPYVNFGSDEGFGYGVIGGVYQRTAVGERVFCHWRDGS